MHTPLPRYNIDKTYDWNYEHSPQDPPGVDVPDFPGDWTLCGLPVRSPLGIPAGPLLNGRWCTYYSQLGFDVLTYKTVRSRQYPCYELPNLLPVACDRVDQESDVVSATSTMEGSWAVSFGMPSATPEVWQKDVASAKERLCQDQLLSVSVVGTIQPGWDMQALADDYAWCAGKARESSADLVETNFSCPNVSTCDGQLYQQPADAAVVARRTREAIGDDCPYLVKIGHVPDPDQAAQLLDALAPYVNGIAMTNSIATQVQDASGSRYFAGQRRGICGAATLEASLRQVETFRQLIDKLGYELDVIGVGGASTFEDVERYLDVGANGVHIATAAMVDPLVGVKIRQSAAKSQPC